MSDRLYDKDRDIIAQGQHYARHVEAMTAEGLHSKSDIAAELAHRDIENERLRARLAEAERLLREASGSLVLGPLFSEISVFLADQPSVCTRCGKQECECGFFGKALDILAVQPTVCRRCNGHGVVPDLRGDQPCPDCSVDKGTAP